MDPNFSLASYVAKHREKNTSCSEILETSTKFGEIEEIHDGVEIRFNSYKNFDIDTYPPLDHRFLNSKHVILRSSFIEKVEQEWINLDENLPNSGFFIRVYEHRIDLMRAVLIGPPDSLYKDCLFFFDISLPENYPCVPPKLFYHSYGLNMNPILRASGEVCLTLLETKYKRLLCEWYLSNAEEKWEPKASNLLHVLNAVKNSILSLRPDSPKTTTRCSFYDTTKGEQLMNNKKMLELKCENMIRVLKNPPLDFEIFVAGHFRQRAHKILLEFKENKDYSQVMIDMFVSLFQVFEKNGTYCKHHLDFLKNSSSNFKM